MLDQLGGPNVLVAAGDRVDADAPREDNRQPLSISPLLQMNSRRKLSPKLMQMQSRRAGTVRLRTEGGPLPPVFGGRTMKRDGCAVEALPRTEEADCVRTNDHY